MQAVVACRSRRFGSLAGTFFESLLSHLIVLTPVALAWSLLANPAPLAPRAAISAALSAFVADPAAQRDLLAHLDADSRELAPRLAREVGARPAEVQRVLEAQVAHNLDDKRAQRGPQGETFPLSADEIRRQIIDYESYKLESFVRSGVFPKRYFGYFDGKWDTARYEQILRDTVRGAAAICNAALAEKHAPVRVTEAEIAVTFIAEGGAILLREKQAELESIHPVYGIGLDDIATGYRLYPELLQRLDTHFGAHLDQVVSTRDGQAYLMRNFTFVEAVLGTALMWTWEKERAEGLLHDAGRPSLATLPPDQQFVLASLVYNSGKLFDRDRILQIRDFATAGYLADISQRNRSGRGELPVQASRAAWAQLRDTGSYPEQPTTWSTVYHVLQRYGAYRALLRFTDVFDDAGAFR